MESKLTSQNGGLRVIGDSDIKESKNGTKES